MKSALNELLVTGKLVSAERLLEELFEPTSRPSLRWLRSQTRSKSIPHIRIGHLVFFDVEMVRLALSSKNLVRHRTNYIHKVSAGGESVKTANHGAPVSA